MKKKRFIFIALAIITIAIVLVWRSYRRSEDVYPHKLQHTPVIEQSATKGGALNPESGKPVGASLDIHEKKTDDNAEMAASLAEKNMLFSDNSFSLRLAVLNALKVSPTDAVLVENIIKKTAYELASKLVTDAKLVKTPSGDVYFSIKKNSTLTDFKKKLATEIDLEVGGSRGNMIAALAANTSIFAQFGEKDLEIYISDQPNPDGLKQTYVTTEIINDPSSKLARTTFYSLVTNDMKNPLFDLLISKFKEELNQ